MEENTAAVLAEPPRRAYPDDDELVEEGGAGMADELDGARAGGAEMCVCGV